MLQTEWAMSVEEAIEAEAGGAGALHDHGGLRAGYRGFARKEKPVFRGD
jgi:hypothetical protein